MYIDREKNALVRTDGPKGSWPDLLPDSFTTDQNLSKAFSGSTCNGEICDIIRLNGYAGRNGEPWV